MKEKFKMDYNSPDLDYCEDNTCTCREYLVFCTVQYRRKKLIQNSIFGVEIFWPCTKWASNIYILEKVCLVESGKRGKFTYFLKAVQNTQQEHRSFRD